MQIDTSLLREKFIIKEKTAEKDNEAAQEMRACSNRIELELQTDRLAKEIFIVRTDSMHLCSRMAGHLLANYENKGPFGPRLKYLKWDVIWDSALSDYEKRYNEGRWVAVYHKGKMVFSEGDHHAFLDIIEQFQSRDETSYSESLGMAEKAFQKAGREVTIDYTSNVALTIVMDRKGGRCSTILRAPKKTTAFHYYIKPKKDNEKVVISQGLTSAANFLEGVNLSYFIGITNASLETEQIEKYSDEAIQMRNARRRLGEIYVKTNSLETRYAIRYRPERPMFDLIIEHTEDYTKERIVKGSPIT